MSVNDKKLRDCLACDSSSFASSSLTRWVFSSAPAERNGKNYRKMGCVGQKKAVSFFPICLVCLLLENEAFLCDSRQYRREPCCGAIMKIWPAIDIRDGNCVRLAQGDYQRQTTYGHNPADMALRWVSDGAQAMHIVDLDAARGEFDSAEQHSPNREASAQILRQCDLPCQVGGGIRSEKAITDYLELGAERVVIGTRAVTDTDWFLRCAEDYPSRLSVAIDARDGRVATDGWVKTSDVSAIDFAKRISGSSIGSIIYTDISKDGMMAGPNFAAMQEMVAATDIPVIASGGVTQCEDIEQLAIMGLSGCIVGRALYEGRLTLREALNASQEVAG